MTHHARRLYDYHVWANQRVFEHLGSLPADVYDQPVQSVFGSISEVLLHVYTVDTLWLAVMHDVGSEEITAALNRARQETQDISAEELEAKFEELSEQYIAFLDDQEDLDRPVTPHHPHLGPLHTQLSELVKHVANHGTYHRGNITAMLRQLGHRGVPTDYAFYLYEAARRLSHLSFSSSVPARAMTSPCRAGRAPAAARRPRSAEAG